MEKYDDAFVTRFLAPWNAHDVDGAMALMTDDCLWEITRGGEPYGAVFRGAEAVRTAIGNAFKSMPDIHYELVRSLCGPDHVVVELLVTGTLPDGTTARFHACDVMTMAAGKVATKRSYRKVAG
jgi:taurine dehydrogenase small subunit